MTQEQYDKSIETGYLQLRLWDKVTHFSIVGFLFFIPVLFLVFHLVGYLRGNPAGFAGGELSILIVPIFLGGLFYWLQKSRLKFKVLNTTLKHEEIVDLIKQLCKEWNWTPYLNNHNIFIAKTKPGALSGSWGEQVTILFNGNTILVNSICDPGEKQSLVSMGHNRENEQAITDLVNNANRLYTKA